MPKIDPIRATDEDARQLARNLLATASYAALGVLDPETGAPVVTRIALAQTGSGAITTLISDLSAHTRALRANPNASLLVGEPGDKGDPLTFARMSLTTRAAFVTRDSDDGTRIRDYWMRHRPKSKIYIDFADFHFVRFELTEIALNGGFGKAYRLTPADLA
ncbi:MAG: pyridoxamine 5'-phosphate oxidase family protein [Pseudomonadota bacterium]